MSQTLSYALTNVLGVASWYLIGIAYLSLAANYWPRLESTRGKWLPTDILAETDQDAEIRHINRTVRAFAVILVLFIFATLWPYFVYRHVKRRFRTENDI